MGSQQSVTPSIIRRSVCAALWEGPVVKGGSGSREAVANGSYFPFPQSVYGNILGARFISHGAERDLRNRRVKVKGMNMWRSKRKEEGQKCCFWLFSVEKKRLCSVCVLHCVAPLLAKATKASIYLSWASSLWEQGLKGRRPSHVPGWRAFSLVNTSELHPGSARHNLHQSEGLLLLTK